jgi:hypothetical protein
MSLHPVDRRLGGPQSRFGTGGEMKENPFTATAGKQTPDVQLVAQSLY